jgi:hypothetical protein
MACKLHHCTWRTGYFLLLLLLLLLQIISFDFITMFTGKKVATSVRFCCCDFLVLEVAGWLLLASLLVHVFL